MKKNYIIPSIESIAFHAGSICDASACGSGTSISGNSGLGSGGQGDNIDPL